MSRVLENYPLLDSWVNTATYAIDEIDKAQLERYRLKLLKNVNSWNEETLKMKFIAFILEMADYDIADFQGIFEAGMSGRVGNHNLKVIIDFTVATVIEDLIEKPYFYFHEYKPKKKQKDPVAQVLLAMLIAQVQNADNRPIYGCHVIGENWCFMILQGKEYSISKPFDATSSAELGRILMILRKFKTILLTELFDSSDK